MAVGTSRTMTMKFRDKIQASSRFAFRNQLPLQLQDQMLAHICLKFRAELLQQEETLNDLSKPICTSIANVLFFPIVDKCIFSNECQMILFSNGDEGRVLFPKGRWHLMNEAPTYFYVLVSGAMDILADKDEGKTEQRDTIQGTSRFSFRNWLPLQLQDQMLAHICLKSRTEGLQQMICQRPSAQALQTSCFFRIVDKVYPFQGVSHDFLFQLVSEMKTKYFPPKEDVILINEASTYFYVLVSGAVVLWTY